MQIIETNLPTNGSFKRRNSTDEIILHHAEASRASVEEVNRWHLERGWTGIGYHFYIRNSRAIGICVEGSYMSETMPQAQLDALKDLIRTMMAKYPGAKLLRHKDVNSTDCPGTKFPWAEVQKYNTETTAKKEETKMTDKEFAAHEERYQAEKANQKPHPYAVEAWQAAVNAGIMDGTKPQSPLTREQLAVILQRLGLLGKGVK